MPAEAHDLLADAPSAAPEAAVTRRRFTSAEWDRMVELGLFGPDERLELVDGEVLVMSPIGDPHATSAGLVAEALRALTPPDTCYVREEKPLRLAEQRLYPDVVLARGQIRDHTRRSPTAAETLLVVEVADTTLAYDLGKKADVYAEARVPEYWVVSIPDRAIVVHRGPRRRRSAPRGWAWSEVVQVAGGKVRPPGARRSVAVKDLLP